MVKFSKRFKVHVVEDYLLSSWGYGLIINLDFVINKLLALISVFAACTTVSGMSLLLGMFNTY